MATNKWLNLFVYTPLVALADVLLIHLSFVSVSYSRSVFLRTAVLDSKVYLHVVPYMSLATVASLYICNLYGPWLRRRMRDIGYSILIAVVGIALFTAALRFWEVQFVLSSHVIIEMAALQVLLLAVYRLLLKKWFLLVRGHRRVMVMAPDEDTAVRIIQKLDRNAPSWMTISGYLMANELDRLEQEAAEFDSVLLTPAMPEQRAIVRQCTHMGKVVMIIPAMQELSLLGARTLEINDMLILSLGQPHLRTGAQIVKRGVDLLGSAVLLSLASPILLVLAIAIRLNSKGPAIFAQDRVGQDGKEYTLYKFRTMIADAEKHTGPVLASESDSRITPLGRWLRATRLDELPQLFNVLKGDMSLVGPRPERAFFVNQFRDTVVGYDLRFSVKPGITGMAQVAGGYSTTVERKLRFDLMYIFNYSLLLDIQILLRTILVVIDKTQAEGISEPISAAVLLQNDK